MPERPPTVSVDIGGTFTDGVFARGDEIERAKVPTTEHDPTVCFTECIAAGAEKLGLTLDELLSGADTVRFSTTLGTNTVIEKTGPRLGVLVTAGHEEDLYADGDEPTVTDAFLDGDLVAGIDERVEPDGSVAVEPDPEAVTDAVKRLQENGARLIAVALANAHADEANERAVKRIVETEYPSHYLGSIPTLASHEITARPGDYRRLNTTVIDAYLHRPMKTSLYRAEDEIRSAGHDDPLLIGHSSGGCARVAKTVALNTYNSGPAAGAMGAKRLAELYGRPVTAADMGGTSIDLSATDGGDLDFRLDPLVGGLSTLIPMADIHTAGAGGGSIASVDDGDLRVGPESAGADPGPACYGRGGTRPTVTDADVVRGVVNPEYFLGGDQPLDAASAEAAVGEHVAAALDTDPVEAARRIAARVERNVADAIEGVSDADDPLLTFYGGAGPVHAAGVARRLGVDTVVVTPYSSVFSAFGESMLDVQHTYNRTVRVGGSRSDPGVDADPDPDSGPDSNVDADAFDRAIDGMEAEARRDMAAEGFDPDDVAFEVDVLVRDPAGDGSTERHRVADAAGLADLVEEEGTDVDYTVRLHARGETPAPGFPTHPTGSADPEPARKGAREVHWEGGARRTPVYQREELDPGNVVDGPAVVEARDTTITVPPEWSFRVDEYDHGLLELA